MKLVDGAAVWRVKAQDGLPLEFALAFLFDHGEIPVWSDLLWAARMDGANITRLAREIVQQTKGVYPEELHSVLRTRLVPLAERLAQVRVPLDN